MTVRSQPRGNSRKKWIIAAIVAAVGIPVAGFAAVYALFFTGDSPAPLALSTSTATVNPNGTAAPSGSLAGEWTVADGSIAGYRVREQLANLPAQSDAVGRTSDVTGSATLAETGGNLVVQAAAFEVDVTTLASDESRRDRRIKTDGLESDTYPKATFSSTAPITVPAGATSGAAVNIDISGDLTIHGVTKNVTIPTQARLNGSQIELVGSITFPFSDFGMTPPSVGGFVEVEDDATMEFSLFLTKAG